MKMKNLKSIIACLFIVFLIQSCKDDECDNVICASNSSFIFELVNTDGDNLLSNGTIELTDVKVVHVETQDLIGLNAYVHDSRDIIEIYSLSLPEGSFNYKVQISENDAFDVLISTERDITDCCDVTFFNEITVSNADFIIDDNYGIYTIVIE